MKTYRSILRPVLLLTWIVFIFSRSLQPGDRSVAESGWVKMLLEWLLPFEVPMLLVRKLGHFTEFAVLGMLVQRCFVRRPGRAVWTALPAAALVCVGTALCDETIQLFVEGRAGMLADVWLDTAGAATGLLLMLAIQSLWGKRQRKKAEPSEPC